ncbi:hypothetical protein RF55_17306 [Lasius niger]|uniref:Uncharacterized protein n=1 Tax=Lasius niger TaxID=67767 RepID=A0A0J7K2N0_LASNI|nr:hypothetical protein RF55_17306 [Lasius niger]
MMEGPGSKLGKMEPIKESEEIRKEEVTDESVVKEKAEETASLEVDRNKKKETPREQGDGQEDLPLSQPTMQQ